MGGCPERHKPEIVILLLPFSDPGFYRVRSLALPAWEVPMDETLTLVIVFVVATAVVFYVTGRMWQRRHTYLEEFWHSGGW